LDILKYLKENDVNYTLLGAGLILASYLKWNENEMPFSTKNELSKLLGVSKNTTTKIRNNLLETGLIYKKDKRLFLNKEMFYKGKDNANKYVKGYSLQIRELNKSLTLSQIGLLFVIIPYIAYGTNVLVSNPQEKDVNKLKSITMSELADIVGVHKFKLSSKLKELKTEINGSEMYLIGRVTAGRQATLIVNPYVLDRKSHEDVINNLIFQVKK